MTKGGKDKPAVGQRRSTRSSKKEAEVAGGAVQKATTTASIASKSKSYTVIQYLAHNLPGAPKRKELDEPVEQAKKRPHIKSQIGVPEEGQDMRETSEGPTEPTERGELTYLSRLTSLIPHRSL
jgi:hypothetical protein